MGKELSLYIHIPFCLSKCSYCDFFSTVCNASVPSSYLQALKNEISDKIKRFDISSFTTLYIGGGTPSLLSKNQLKDLFDFLNPYISSCREISMEVNPDDLSEDYISFLNSLPVTRLSCGIQSLNEESLSCVKRRAGLKENLRALDLLHNKWNKDFSIDLICALPFESCHTFTDGLKKIFKYQPSHISLYSLTLEEGTRLFNEVHKGFIKIDDDFMDQLWLQSRVLLKEQGFEQYEVSNFSKKGKESLHNLVYWNHLSYIGCGLSACGTLYNEDGSAKRFNNKNDLSNYINFYWQKYGEQGQNYELVEDCEEIDIETSVYEYFMMGFRKLSGISSKDFYNKFKISLPQKYIEVFKNWKNKGLLVSEKNEDDIRFFLNSEGILFLNKFLEDLLF